MNPILTIRVNQLLAVKICFLITLLVSSTFAAELPREVMATNSSGRLVTPTNFFYTNLVQGSNMLFERLPQGRLRIHSTATGGGGGGTTINPTDSFVPYRIDASSFGDSRFRTNTIAGMQLNGGLWFYGIGSTNAAITNRHSTETLDLVTGDGSSYGNLNLGQLWIHEQFLPQLNTASFAGAGHVVASLTVIQPVSAVLGSTNSVILDGTPTIPDGTSDGQIKWIVGRGNVTNTVTLQSESLFPGTNLRLEAPTRTLDRGNVLALLWDSVSSTWNEIGFSSGGIWLDVGGVYTPTSTNRIRIYPNGGVEIGTLSYGDPGVGLAIHSAMTNGFPGFVSLYADAEGTNDISVFNAGPTVTGAKQSLLAMYYQSNAVNSGSTFTFGPSYSKFNLYVNGLNYIEFDPTIANGVGSVPFRWDTTNGMSLATNAYAFRTQGTNRLAIAGDAVFPNDAAYFFNGQGRWSIPSGGSGGSSIWTNFPTGTYKPTESTANILQFGSNSLATARDSIVLGRDNTNAPSAVASTISGGTNNWILSNSVAATISGGADNFVDAGVFGATISGGVGHQIDGGLGNFYGTISGGLGNRIVNTAQIATIGGGQGHVVHGTGGTIGGGSVNVVQDGDYGTVAGGFNNIAAGDWSFIGGGSENIMFANATGGNALASAIGGGYRNVIGSNPAGGANYGFIGGGRTNTIPDVSDYGFIGGGSFNQIGGGGNQVFGNAIAGGFNNLTEDLIDYAFIGGGMKNRAAGDWSAILGGFSNNVTAARAMAVGSLLTNSTANSVESGYWLTKTRVDPSAFTVHNIPVILTNTLGGTQPLVRWVETNGTAYTQITVTNAGSTNNIVISLGPNTVAADQTFKVHSTTLAGGVNTIVLTNSVPPPGPPGTGETNWIRQGDFLATGDYTNQFRFVLTNSAILIGSNYLQLFGLSTTPGIKFVQSPPDGDPNDAQFFFVVRHDNDNRGGININLKTNRHSALWDVDTSSGRNSLEWTITKTNAPIFHSTKFSSDVWNFHPGRDAAEANRAPYQFGVYDNSIDALNTNVLEVYHGLGIQSGAWKFAIGTDGEFKSKTNLFVFGVPPNAVTNRWPTTNAVAGQTLTSDGSTIGNLYWATPSASGGGSTKTNLMLSMTFDGGGQPLATNLFTWFSCTNAMTITSWQIVGYPDTSSIVVDLRKDTFANFPPTSADTIAGTELPTLLSQNKNSDGTLSTWTTSVNPGDWFEARILNATNVQYCVISVYGF